MSQVSKKPLSKDIEDKMFKIFWESIAKLTDPSDVERFFDDLLSDVEKTMLSKRLAIAFLLAKNYGYQSIKETLKVSNATISSVNLWLREGGKGYNLVIDKLLQADKTKEFLKKVEDNLADIFKYGVTGKLLQVRRATRERKGPLG